MTGRWNCRSFCAVPKCIAFFTFAVFVIISGDCNYPEHYKYIYILEFVPAAYDNKTIWLCAMSLRSVSVPYITYFKTKTLLLWRVLLTGFWLIEAEWRIYASLNWVIIGSDNGLSPVRRQAIIWTNAGILLIGPLGTTQWKFHRNWNIFIQVIAFKNVCKMASILSQPQWVNGMNTF